MRDRGQGISAERIEKYRAICHPYATYVNTMPDVITCVKILRSFDYFPPTSQKATNITSAHKVLTIGTVTTR